MTGWDRTPFFATQGYGPLAHLRADVAAQALSHKAILGTAYELATGHRFAPGDFEGGKARAVAVRQKLGFTVEGRSG